MRITSKDLARAKKAGKFVSPEGKVADQVCRYLKVLYPKVLFKFDFGAGAILTGQQAAQQGRMQCVRGWPDLFIVEPRHCWQGLFIELKREDEKLYKANGLFRTEHLEDQSKVHLMLAERGYKCHFAAGFEVARILIDQYLNLK